MPPSARRTYRFLKTELAGERKPFILAGRDKVLAHPWLGKDRAAPSSAPAGGFSNLDEVNDSVLAAHVGARAQ